MARETKLKGVLMFEGCRYRVGAIGAALVILGGSACGQSIWDDLTFDCPDGDVPVLTHETFDLESLGGVDALRSCAPFSGVGVGIEGDSPAGVAFGPDGSWFVSAHRESRNLLVFDADTRDLIREIPLSGSPADLAVSTDGRWAVTPNLFEQTASIVDLDTGAEVAVVPVGEAPVMARITPDGTIALVGSTVDEDLAVIDLATGTELRRIGGLDFGMVLSANFEAWATGFACANPVSLASDTIALFPDVNADQIGFIDITTGSVTFVPTDDAPRGIAISQDGTRAVVSHAGSVETLKIFDIGTQAEVSTINVGVGLRGPITLDPGATKAVVAVSNAVRVVDLVNGTSGADLNTASVNQLLTTADGRHALCVGFRGSLISFSTDSLVTNLNNVISTTFGAVSPTDTRAVMLATTFGEDMVIVDTDGSGGSLEDVLPSGPVPEGDKPRTVAVSPDGSRIVTTNQFSRNASVFDRDGAPLGIADTGLRPGQVRITPDGTKAVVTNRDADFISVIDLDTLDVDEVTISTRGDQCRLSPDGTYAYVAVVVSDGIWRVNLDTLQVEGARLPVGEMGGVSYTGNQFSGIALSNDGETLVACNTYDDTITIIDTLAWSVVATVSVGDFPSAAVFSPDDARIYVTNRTDETVSVVTNAGAGSTRLVDIAVGNFPYRAVPNAGGTKLYVMNTSDDAIGVIDTVFLNQDATIPLSETPVAILSDASSGQVLVGVGTASASSNGQTSQSGELAIIDTVTDTVVETLCADHFLSDLAADASFGLAAAPGLGGESAVFFDRRGECRVDINRDGSVNTQDVVSFLNLWVSSDADADWDDSGTVDTRDFLAFLNDWNAGC